MSLVNVTQAYTRVSLFILFITICQVFGNNIEKVTVLTDLTYIKLQNVPVISNLLKYIFSQNINQVTGKKETFLNKRSLKITSDILFSGSVQKMWATKIEEWIVNKKDRIWDHISQTVPLGPEKLLQHHRVLGNILVIKGDVLTYGRYHMNHQY